MAQSEVARMRQRLADEYQAAKWGLTGQASGTSKHQFITARMENMGKAFETLTELVGSPEEVGKIIVETAEQATFPLQTEALRSTMAFCQYLQYYELSLLDVALTARVRYSSVWNIAHGNPVKSAHAAQVRWGLQHLTGVPYTASIVLTP